MAAAAAVTSTMSPIAAMQTSLDVVGSYAMRTDPLQLGEEEKGAAAEASSSSRRNRTILNTFKKKDQNPFGIDRIISN